jgi:hypothetical protein
MSDSRERLMANHVSSQDANAGTLSARQPSLKVLLQNRIHAARNSPSNQCMPICHQDQDPISGNTASLLSSVQKSSRLSELWLFNNSLSNFDATLIGDAVKSSGVDSLHLMQPSIDTLKAFMTSIRDLKLDTLFISLTSSTLPAEFGRTQVASPSS